MSNASRSLKQISDNSFVSKELFAWSNDWDVLWTLQSTAQTLNELKTIETHEVVMSRRHGRAEIRLYKNEPVNYDLGEVSVVAHHKDGKWIFRIGPWIEWKADGK